MGALLSICIPTYSRKDKLARLLENIASEAKGIEGEIEVCVSDNCSPDGTRGYLEGKWKKAPFATRFLFNEKNNGFDVNVFEALKLGSGRHLWLMGDDDGVVRDSLGKLVSFLKGLDDEKVKVIYLVAVQGGKDASDIKNHSIVITPKEEAMSSELVKNPNAFMSSIIMKKEAFDSLDRNAVKRGVGTLYMHCWLLRLIGLHFPEGRARYFEKPVCWAEPSGVKSEEQLAGSSGKRIGLPSEAQVDRGKKPRPGLRQELKYSKSMMKQYLDLFICDSNRRYVLFSLKKIAGSLFFPFFEILCERVFRAKEKERVEFGFYQGLFGFLGLPGAVLYLFRAFVWLLPDFAAGAFLKSVLFFSGLLRLTNDARYEFWERFWVA